MTLVTLGRLCRLNIQGNNTCLKMGNCFKVGLLVDVFLISYVVFENAGFDVLKLT